MNRAFENPKGALMEKANDSFNRLVNSGPLPIVSSKWEMGLELVISNNGIQRLPSKIAIKKLSEE